MGRAKQFFVPGVIWHITHRCHNRAFLLKFHKDRRCWATWLFKAKRHYGLTVLNYAVTSNHIHLLVKADHSRWVIPRSMQLVAGRTGWEYNQRKNRSGAFWEDNYHATAVENDRHLLECMVYIDLNMVRAGVIDHPGQWRFCGYSELMGKRQRYRLIDRKALMEAIGLKDNHRLEETYHDLIEARLSQRIMRREGRWTESIAVGSDVFVKQMKERLGYRARYRNIASSKRCWTLREPID